MQRIRMIAEQIHKELESAEYYAEHYIQAKTDGKPDWSERAKIMAEDELRHATFLHEYAASEIDKLKKHYRPSTKMQDAWDAAHKEYITHFDWIKDLLA